MTEKKNFDFDKQAIRIEAATRKAFQEMVADHADFFSSNGSINRL